MLQYLQTSHLGSFTDANKAVAQSRCLSTLFSRRQGYGFMHLTSSMELFSNELLWE